MKILFSVVIPCFNSELTVESAINSAIFQTYKPFEIIIVDDASKDKTTEIVRGLIDKITDPKDARTFVYKPSFELMAHLGVRNIEELPDKIIITIKEIAPKNNALEVTKPCYVIKIKSKKAIEIR